MDAYWVSELKWNAYIQSIAKDVGKKGQFIVSFQKGVRQPCFIFTRTRSDKKWSIVTISDLGAAQFSMFRLERENEFESVYTAL